MKVDSEADVLEPEVIPPGSSSRGGRTAEATGPNGVNPIVAGLIVDIINMFTMGLPGFIIGAVFGYWVAFSHRMPVILCLMIAMAVGWYCGLPLPRTVPLATLVGVIIVLWRKWR
jgi:hypothetical protein